jgi:hypothetical protein
LEIADAVFNFLMRSTKSIHRQKNPLPFWRACLPCLLEAGVGRDEGEGKRIA